MIELFNKAAGFFYFYRWHPEVAVRYMPVVRFINKHGKKDSVLDVGSGGLGIAPYLKRRITGLDEKFYPPYYPELEMVTGNARKMPFKDSSFDIVISMDMLEHLNKNFRTDAISEMIRVAKNYVCIGVPCGQKSLDQDKTLDLYYSKVHQSRYHFLEEQINNGLPDKKDILASIIKGANKYRKIISIKVVPNENLSLRLFLMKGWLSKGFFRNLFYRKILLFFLPLFINLNSEPAYRQIYFVKIQNENSR